MVDSNRLEKARTDKQEGLAMIQEVTSQHSREMLKAKPWRCIICQKRATRLYLQAMLTWALYLAAIHRPAMQP
ncbi:hypothetical protein OEZ85_008239 [Tetradesmus obliquus]|uniref:Uncharacterized protein n=1 Tax=Tetradesmus obliquus TaxID=3088 RepID=A0ABY8TIL8_TETOB|nr:hypothetical protein OEZ85_008239 [Tetradesmus obliquus]